MIHFRNALTGASIYTAKAFKQMFMKNFFTSILLLCSLAVFSQSNSVVISQVYGGGGGGTGTYLNDYVELHNVSSATQSIAGYSLQYGSASGNFGSAATNIYVFPAGTSIPAGGYFLIQLSAAGTAGAALPVPADLVTTNLSMSGVSGKVALVNSGTALGCGATATLCTLPAGSIIDLVAFGAANNAEGGTSVNNGAGLTSTQGAVRKAGGCQDTDNNNNDFDVITAPVPRNSASPILSCVAGPNLVVTGSLSDFGTVFIGSNSAAQSYTLSGTLLSPAAGFISVSAPAQFEVSLDNAVFANAASIPYSGGSLAITTLWIRFAPATAGAVTGNIVHSGGGVSPPVNIAVSGTGAVVPTTPLFTATALAPFGSVCVNTVAGPAMINLSAVNLTTADVTVGPLSGFSFSATVAGTYTPSLSFTQTGGSFNQDIYIKFSPVAIQNYSGNIPVAGGGAASINIAVTAEGSNNAPAVVSGSVSGVTTIAATISGSITNAGCTAVSAYGFEYSLINGFTNGTVLASTNLSGGSFNASLTALTPSTTYYYKAFAVNAAGTGYGVQRSFVTAAPIISVTPLTGFGTVCVGTVPAPNSFAISSTGLNSSNVTVGPLAGFTFATSQAGTYTNSLSISQPGGVFSQTVFVKFTPTAVQNYNGNIIVAGGGASNANVPVSASGVNTIAIVATGTPTAVTANSATVSATIGATGCSAVTNYGIEYSGIANFGNGQGIKVLSAGSATAFTSILNGLVPNTTYYYKAFATNGGGTAYGTQASFTTTALPAGFVVYENPVQRGGLLHYSVKEIKNAHYQIRIFNSVGQVVHSRDAIVQVGFIDEVFRLPMNLGAGLYSLQINGYGYQKHLQFMIR